MDKKTQRVYDMSFATVYPLYLTKVQKKGRTQEELDILIIWLTGYTKPELEKIIEDEISFQDFFVNAPKMNPNANLITGLICGIRVETIEDPIIQKVRYLDKIVDELAKGRKMDKILRSA